MLTTAGTWVCGVVWTALLAIPLGSPEGWISTDGDDTGSTFTLLLTSLTVGTADASRNVSAAGATHLR